MELIKKQYKFKSSSGLCDIFAEGYFPADGVKAVVQIAHGMAEHHERYEDFIAFLNRNGIAVYINDHLGHGKSVENDNELGYFGKEKGHYNLVDDMKKLTDIAKSENPDIPFVLFGHSMGSMLARLYTSKYGSSLDGVVYCGTTGPNPAASVGMALTKLIAKAKGDHYRSKFIDKLAFGAYNKKCTPQRTAFDWLTRDDAIVDKYIADPLCGFLFTAYGYRDLMNMIIDISSEDWYKSVLCALPIFVISGEADPVGAYGKGIKAVYDSLKEAKRNAQMKLYDGMRHEILNENGKEDVYKDVLDWIEKLI